MTSITKVFNGEPLPIEVINDREFMIDVSGVINAYNKEHGTYKRFSRWKDDAVGYIDAVRAGTNLKQDKLIFESGNVKKIHNKLLISFARYLSDEFAVWCDNTIYDILLGLKDDQIEKLTNEKHVCNIYFKNGKNYTSCRGLVQHTGIEYDEKTIKQNLFTMGYIEPYYKRTKHWRVTERGKKTGLFDLDNAGTVLYDIDRIEDVLKTKVIEMKNSNHILRKVHVYNGFTGEYHATFDSHRQAERELGISNVSQVVDGKKDHVRGMVFIESEEPKDKIDPLPEEKLKKVFRDINVFKDGVFIERCKTAKEAGEIGGNGATQVRRLLKSGKQNNKGYSYAYAELDFKRRRPKEYNSRKRS